MSLHSVKDYHTTPKYSYGKPVWEQSKARPMNPPLVVLVEVAASSDAHVWLSDGSGSKSRGYELVIGGWKNSRSEIRRGQQGTSLACILHEEGPLGGGKKRFWISLLSENGSVSIVVGTGWDLWKHSFLVGVDSSKKRMETAESVSVSTGFGAEGDWTIHVTEKSIFKTQDDPRATEDVSATPQRVSHTLAFSTPIHRTLVSSLAGPSGLLKRPRDTSANPVHVDDSAYGPSKVEQGRVRSDMHRALTRG